MKKKEKLIMAGIIIAAILIPLLLVPFVSRQIESTLPPSFDQELDSVTEGIHELNVIVAHIYKKGSGELDWLLDVWNEPLGVAIGDFLLVRDAGIWGDKVYDQRWHRSSKFDRYEPDWSRLEDDWYKKLLYSYGGEDFKILVFTITGENRERVSPRWIPLVSPLWHPGPVPCEVELFNIKGLQIPSLPLERLGSAEKLERFQEVYVIYPRYWQSIEWEKALPTDWAAERFVVLKAEVVWKENRIRWGADDTFLGYGIGEFYLSENVPIGVPVFARQDNQLKLVGFTDSHMLYPDDTIKRLTPVISIDFILYELNLAGAPLR